jgi:glycosyltransferase involved in cell wall biosynthesis
VKKIPVVMVSERALISDRVRESVERLGQPFVHFVRERKAYDKDKERNRILNIAAARTIAFAQALHEHPEAEYFLTVDSDIVVPPDILERFLEVADGVNVFSAWWRTRFGESYVGGSMRGRVLELFSEVKRDPRLTQTDFVSLGCALVPRFYVDGHFFEPGVRQLVKDRRGNVFCIADSGAFSMWVSFLGGKMFLDSCVVAEHLSLHCGIEY